jgi:hypothetical protein
MKAGVTRTGSLSQEKILPTPGNGRRPKIMCTKKT